MVIFIRENSRKWTIIVCYQRGLVITDDFGSIFWDRAAMSGFLVDKNENSCLSLLGLGGFGGFMDCLSMLLLRI